MYCMYSCNTCITSFFFFFFNDTATTEIYTLSLHDALPISYCPPWGQSQRIALPAEPGSESTQNQLHGTDRKSTRLNSSHGYISYAVFCLKKKKITTSQSMPSTHIAWCVILSHATLAHNTRH